MYHCPACNIDSFAVEVNQIDGRTCFTAPCSQCGRVIQEVKRDSPKAANDGTSAQPSLPGIPIGNAVLAQASPPADTVDYIGLLKSRLEVVEDLIKDQTDLRAERTKLRKMLKVAGIVSEPKAMALVVPIKVTTSVIVQDAQEPKVAAAE